MSDRLTLLEQLLEKNPNDPFTLFALAKEYEGLADDAGALHWYEKLRAGHPAYVGLYYHLGKLYERIGDAGRALEAYDAGIDVSRKAGNAHALSELATARLNLADPDDA